MLKDWAEQNLIFNGEPLKLNSFQKNMERMHGVYTHVETYRYAGKDIWALIKSMYEYHESNKSILIITDNVTSASRLSKQLLKLMEDNKAFIHGTIHKHDSFANIVSSPDESGKRGSIRVICATNFEPAYLDYRLGITDLMIVLEPWLFSGIAMKRIGEFLHRVESAYFIGTQPTMRYPRENKYWSLYADTSPQVKRYKFIGHDSYGQPVYTTGRFGERVPYLTDWGTDIYYSFNETFIQDFHF